MSAVTIDGKEILVRPPKYPSDEVKTELGGRWDPQNKAWRLQPTRLNMLTIRDWYGDAFFDDCENWDVLDLAFDEWGFESFDKEQNGQRPNEELWQRARSHPSWSTLFDFQKEGVEYLVCNPHRGAVLGLSPGLGKSATAAVAADVLDLRRVLILAPLTLARNWIAEFEKWSNLYRSWSRATAASKDPLTESVVTNHETLYEVYFQDYEFVDGKEKWWDVDVPGGPAQQKKWIEVGTEKHPAPYRTNPKTGKREPARRRKVECRGTYIDHGFDLLIIDESVLLKNRKAVKVQTALELCQFTPYVWLLSGSATAKYRNDLYPQMKCIMPRGFSSYWRFVEFFCTVDKGAWGWKITGDRPDRDPLKYLSDFMLVINQKDALPELPDYIYEPMEVELTAPQRKAYDSMAADWLVELEGDEPVTTDYVISQLTRLAQITSNLCNIPKGKNSSAKEDLLVTLIEEDQIEFPLLVWTWWVPTAKSIAKRLSKLVGDSVQLVTGSMDGSEKQDAIDSYKRGDASCLVLQMGVGKFGHTFTDTRTVYYHDRHWDSDAYLQSLRRVKRIGLTHNPRLIVPRCERSTDPIVELNLAGKLSSVAKIGKHDLKELMQSLGAGIVPWEMNYAD